jgi:hypothetical protein
VRLNGWFIAPLLVLISIGMIVSYRADVPQRADWQAATETVRAELKPGDGVTWAPYYMGEGRVFFHDLPAFHTPDGEPANFSRFRRVWVLLAPNGDLKRFQDRHHLVETRPFGPLTLALFQVKGPRVVADLYADLDDVVVRRGRGGKAPVCDFWDGRGWHCQLRLSEAKTAACLAESTRARLNRHRRRRSPACGLNQWLNVSRDIRVIGRKPRRCVWLHPNRAAPTSIQWRPPQTEGELLLEYGFTDKVITDNTHQKTRTQALNFRVLADGVEIDQRRLQPEKGWHRWRIASPEATELTLEVTTKSHVDAHFCIDATIRTSESGQ